MRTFGRVVQWIAIAYCVLVVVVAIVVGIALTQSNPGDPNFAGVWLILVTLPTSMLLSFVPPGGTVVMVAVTTAAGFLQGGLLWFIGRVFRRAGEKRPSAV